MEQATPIASAAEGTPVSSASSAPLGPILRSSLADQKAVRRVLPGYVSELPMQIATVSARLADDDLAAVRRLVHGLRGSGGGYGFPDITRVASDAETAIDAGADLAAVRVAVDALIEIVRRVEGYDRASEHV